MTLVQIIIVLIAGMLLAFLVMQIIGYEATIQDLEEDLYYARNQALIDLKDFEDSQHLATSDGVIEANNFSIGSFFIDNHSRVVWKVIENRKGKKVFHASGILEVEDWHMDTLTKLKMLSNKLDNPIFASKFSKDFEEFLKNKK